MAYTYQLGFKIKEEQMEMLRIGSNLEKVIGSLRTMLPGEPGFISARGMHTVYNSGSIRVLVQSSWEQWDDLLLHQRSGLAEQKVLAEFGPDVIFDDLHVQIFKEVP